MLKAINISPIKSRNGQTMLPPFHHFLRVQQPSSAATVLLFLNIYPIVVLIASSSLVVSSTSALSAVNATLGSLIRGSEPGVDQVLSSPTQFLALVYYVRRISLPHRTPRSPKRTWGVDWWIRPTAGLVSALLDVTFVFSVRVRVSAAVKGMTRFRLWVGSVDCEGV